MKQRQMLAIDLGASNGRALLGSFNGKILNLQSIHRFRNEPVYAGGHWHWDVLHLFKEVQDGLRGTCAATGGPPDSLGLDAWGVDFGLLDSRDGLIGNPYHYRDSRIEGMVEAAFKKMSPALLYQETGNSFEKYNTIFQLMATLQTNPDALTFGKTLLLMADLFVFFLTGEKATEFTAASTTQLLCAGRSAWNERVLEAMGIPGHLFTRIERPACIRGSLLRSQASEIGVPQLPIVTVGHHDTASAVVALQIAGSDYAFLNSGTWSLIGIETTMPVINDAGRELGYTNEGCVGGSYRLLKNLMGLWILQECKRSWDIKGNHLDFAGLCALASDEASLRCFVDPGDDSFFAPGDMPSRIQAYCRRTPLKMTTAFCVLYRQRSEALELTRSQTHPRQRSRGSSAFL